MPEIKKGMVPEEGDEDVPSPPPAKAENLLPPSKDSVSEDVKTPEIPPAETEEKPAEESAKAPAGSKTPETHLLASLKKEREERRALEQELKGLKESSPAPSYEFTSEEMSDEGRAIRQEIVARDKRVAALEETLKATSDRLDWADLSAAYPVLTEKRAEFDEFRAANLNLTMHQAAKQFLFDAGLATPAPARQGVEKPSGGEKTEVKPGTPKEDVADLMERSPRQWAKRLRSGELDPEKIK